MVEHAYEVVEHSHGAMEHTHRPAAQFRAAQPFIEVSGGGALRTGLSSCGSWQLDFFRGGGHGERGCVQFGEWTSLW